MKSKIQALSISIASVLVGILVATDHAQFYPRSIADDMAATKSPLPIAEVAKKSAAAVMPQSAMQVATIPSTQPTLKPAAQPALDPEIENMIISMPLKTKVGQMMIVGFMGDNAEYSLKEILEKVQPGAIIVFGRNIKTARQVAKLNFHAQTYSLANSKIPLLIAVDQEGGNVIRIHTPYPLPSALALSETKDMQLVRQSGRQTGILLRALGFNMNLAPVLDVSDPEKDTFIGTRTFGKLPDVVTKMGSAFAEGLTSAGILPTAKHFPGHGGANDSHLDMPEKLTSLDQLLGFDLLPFRQISQSRSPWAIMVAHVSYPKVDSSLLPATFSKVIMTDLLRNRMGFRGIVMTDDIEMAGASVIKDIRKRAVASVLAGADLVMLAWNKREQVNVADTLIKSVKSGLITEARIDQSVRRILLAKKAMGVLEKQNLPSEKDLSLALKNSDLKLISEFTLRNKFRLATQADSVSLPAQSNPSATPAASKAATMVSAARTKGPVRASLPAIADNQEVLVFTGSDKFYRSFRNSLNPKRLSRQIRLTVKNDVNVNQVMKLSPKSVGLFFISGAQSAKILNSVTAEAAGRMVIVNTETPGIIASPTSFRNVIETYFRHPEVGAYTAKYIFNQEPIPLDRPLFDPGITSVPGFVTTKPNPASAVPRNPATSSQNRNQTL